MIPDASTVLTTSQTQIVKRRLLPLYWIKSYTQSNMIVKMLYHYFFILCYTYYIVNTIKINSSEVNQMDHTNNSCCCGEAE